MFQSVAYQTARSEKAKKKVHYALLCFLCLVDERFGAGPVAANSRSLSVATGVGDLVEAVAADLETELEAIPFDLGGLSFRLGTGSSDFGAGGGGTTTAWATGALTSSLASTTAGSFFS